MRWCPKSVRFAKKCPQSVRFLPIIFALFESFLNTLSQYWDSRIIIENERLWQLLLFLYEKSNKKALTQELSRVKVNYAGGGTRTLHTSHNTGLNRQLVSSKCPILNMISWWQHPLQWFCPIFWRRLYGLLESLKTIRLSCIHTLHVAGDKPPNLRRIVLNHAENRQVSYYIGIL